MQTLLVYLNSVRRGGRTRWRWTRHDERLGGDHHRQFYEAPCAGSGETLRAEGSGDDVSIQPERGMAVVFFPSVTAEHGGFTDYNCYHEAEPAADERKVVCQLFVWSHPGLNFHDLLAPDSLPSCTCATCGHATIEPSEVVV